jgi:PBP1b-binding outer membrane lipoprotein LpoB
MKTVVAIFVVMILVAGCSTLTLSPEATQAEKRLAQCRDAQTAYLLSVAMLESIVPPPAKVYWEAYKAGAMIGLQAYCPAQTSVVASK